MQGLEIKDLDINDSEQTNADLQKVGKTHPFHCGDKLQSEFIEFISRRAVECTCTSVYLDILKTNEDTTEKDETEQEGMEVVYNIRANNNLDQGVKGIVRQCSIYGKSYPFFDIDEFGNITLSTYIPHGLNHTTKYKQNKEFVATGVRQLFKSKFYFGSYVAEQRTFNENTLFPILNNSIQVIPNGIFNFEIPPTIKKELQFGNYQTNYQFLSVKEILNKNRIDYKFNDFEMCDTYPAGQGLKSLNILNTFFNDEPRLDHSMQFGTFDYTTLTNKIIGKNLADELEGDIAQTPNTRTPPDKFLDRFVAIQKLRQDPFLSKKFFNLRGQNPQVQILQTSFDGQKHLMAIDKLYDFIAGLSGYTYSFQNQQASRTNAGIETLNKRDFETTRDKVNLFQNQLLEFFQRVFGAYFRLKYGDEKVGLKAYELTPKLIDFRIISSLINETLNKDEMNIAKTKAGIISKSQAIENANIQLPLGKLEQVKKEIEIDDKHREELEQEKSDKEGGIGVDKNVMQEAQK